MQVLYFHTELRGYSQGYITHPQAPTPLGRYYAMHLAHILTIHSSICKCHGVLPLDCKRSLWGSLPLVSSLECHPLSRLSDSSSRNPKRLKCHTVSQSQMAEDSNL